MSELLYRSDIPGLTPSFRGKVRDMYEFDGALLLVATDRLSAFDVVLPTPIPEKGRVLTEMSRFWFAHTGEIVSNHLLDTPLSEVMPDDVAERLGPRSLLVRKTDPLPIEAVVRGYLAGSGWQEYQRDGSVCGITLPAGLRQADRLPEPIFTPATKAEPGEHDENISFARAADLIGTETARQVRELSLEVYRSGAAWAAERGILIADTKLEFGRVDGEFILIDEVLTPDSSRFWPVAEYSPGSSPPSFDKQYVRDYLLASGWNRQPPGPELPPEVVARTSAKYQEALQRLTAEPAG